MTFTNLKVKMIRFTGGRYLTQFTELGFYSFRECRHYPSSHNRNEKNLWLHCSFLWQFPLHILREGTKNRLISYLVWIRWLLLEETLLCLPTTSRLLLSCLTLSMRKQNVSSSQTTKLCHGEIAQLLSLLWLLASDLITFTVQWCRNWLYKYVNDDLLVL